MSPLDVAVEAWGDDLPDWIRALAIECGRTSQSRVAARLGRSAALVSTVLRRKYNGDMAGVEDLVRGLLLNATVECPSLGTIPTHHCTAWRRKAREFASGNPLRLRMYRACQTCPRNSRPEADTDEEVTNDAS